MGGRVSSDKDDVLNETEDQQLKRKILVLRLIALLKP